MCERSPFARPCWFWELRGPRTPAPAVGGAAATAVPKLHVTNSDAVDATAAMPIVAIVNGEEISRELLGQECLRHYGREVLDGMINRRLIAQECQRQNVEVTRVDVNQEIERMATKFGLPVEQWYKLLKSERGIKPAQYAADIVWPMLALRKLAGSQLQVSRAELIALGKRNAARRSACGPSCSTIPATRRTSAPRRWRIPTTSGISPSDTPRTSTARRPRGRLQPIRKHTGDPRSSRRPSR